MVECGIAVVVGAMGGALATVLALLSYTCVMRRYLSEVYPSQGHGVTGDRECISIHQPRHANEVRPLRRESATPVRGPPRLRSATRGDGGGAGSCQSPGFTRPRDGTPISLRKEALNFT